MWQAGGCPCEHHTDSLPAAFRNLVDHDDVMTRYAAPLEHALQHAWHAQQSWVMDWQR
jgi:hypothetical protein